MISRATRFPVVEKGSKEGYPKAKAQFVRVEAVLSSSKTLTREDSCWIVTVIFEPKPGLVFFPSLFQLDCFRIFFEKRGAGRGIRYTSSPSILPFPRMA